MSYDYYKEELERLPVNDPDGLSIQIRAGDGTHTKWLNLNDECKDALRRFIAIPVDGDETMSDAELMDYWREQFLRISNIEASMRQKLATLLIESKFCRICPASWKHILKEVEELIHSWKLLNGSDG